MAIGELEDVYCTLVMSDSYLPGAAVLALSLRDNGTKKKLACLVTLDTLRPSTITELKSLFDYILPVDRIGNPNPSNLYLMNRGDLLYAFTKVNLWRQTQFRRIVYLDADIVVLRAPDELFDLPCSFAAAPDVGWPDIFNTGVMVMSPNMGEYWGLKTLAATGDTFDGADQGLLNQYYENKAWHRLSFTYNCTPSANYQYEPAYRYYKSKISLVHFIGKEKPWMTTRAKSAAPGGFNEMLYRWWAVYDTHFRAPTHDYMSGRYTPASSVTEPDPIGTYKRVEPDSLVTATTPDLAKPSVQVDELIKDTVDLAHAPEPAPEPKPAVESTPAVESKRFEPPSMEWDATRSAPPSESRPEAANFPTKTYEFNKTKDLFQAPKSYPEPPKDMWYEVPKEKPAPPEVKPPPIFPWEQRDPVKPTRVFADEIESPIPSPPIEKAEAESPLTPITPTIKVTSDQPWSAFEAGNAWDHEPGIDRYVRALHKRNKSLPSNDLRPSTGEVAASPAADLSTQFERQESLVLTHFPSEIDRPSLPVTPAPIRRPLFWGEERDEAGKLPSAEGVPDQADWDPHTKLEELRRHSLILSQPDFSLSNVQLPQRKMPSTAVQVPESVREAPTSTATVIQSPQPTRGVNARFGGVMEIEDDKSPSPSKGVVPEEGEEAFLGE